MNLSDKMMYAVSSWSNACSAAIFGRGVAAALVSIHDMLLQAAKSPVDKLLHLPSELTSNSFQEKAKL